MDSMIGGAILVGLLAFLGVSLQIRANEKNISRQVKEELEKEMKLLIEKIRIEREDKWWNLRFDVLLEFKKLISNIGKMIEEGRIEDLLYDIQNIGIHCNTIFENESLSDFIAALTEYLDKPIKQIVQEENMKKLGVHVSRSFHMLKIAVDSPFSE